MSITPSTPLSRIRRLVANEVAIDLTAFVVPDVRMAHALRLDPEAAGLRIVSNPRHASVLLIVRELPVELDEAAAIVFSQMPQPRGILIAGSSASTPNIPGVITTDSGQDGLIAGVERLRSLLARSPGTSAVFPTTDEIRSHADASSRSTSFAPGPIRVNAGAIPDGKHDDAKDGKEPASDSAGDTNHTDDMGGMDHGGMGGMDGMDHGDFMSMVAMTEGTPRSRDGLQMEWVETPFGPLFPGLPGGLTLTLTLDGDTIARATARSTVAPAAGRLPVPLPCPISSLPRRLAAIDPFAPVAYRTLAKRAIRAASVAVVRAAGDEDRSEVIALEHERVASHLGWLSAFANLIGVGWLKEQAAELNLAVGRVEMPLDVLAHHAAIEQFLRGVGRMPLLGRRLDGIGHLPREEAAQATGPVARASGQPTDARSDDPAYSGFGFQPVVADGGDAGSRLHVRLGEIRQSLGLIAAANERDNYAGTPRRTSANVGQGGVGTASIETPRGTATLHVHHRGRPGD